MTPSRNSPHPDRQTLRSFVRGELTRRQNLKAAWHLKSCDDCRSIARRFKGGKVVLETLFAGLE